MNQVTRLDKAKAQLVLDHPFFASILMKRRLVERKDIPTLAVDQRGTIYYNPEFIASLSVPQIVWGLAHETMHVVGQHAGRRGSRMMKKWNIATDAWINDTLTSCKVGEPIENTVNMPGSKDKTSEQIYSELPDDEDGGGKGRGKGKGGQGSGDDPMSDDILEEGEPLSPSEASEQEAQIKIDVAQAAQAAKMRGKLPGGLQRYVDEIINSKVPWYELLEKYVVSFTSQDLSWRRPNKRHVSSGHYLPSVGKVPEMGTVVIGVDTSGSIGGRELACFAGHVNRILEQCHPEKVYVVYCDSAINHVDEYTQDDLPIKLTPHGGGGTDMGEIVRWIDSEGIEPDVCVILTDGYTPWPSTTPCDLIWAISTDITAPIGETVHFEMEE